MKNGRKTEDYELLTKAVSEVSQLIEKSKGEYYYRLGKRLNNPSTCAKTYWTILKTFYNKRKIPHIAPLLVNNTFVTDFTEKTNLFNDFFTNNVHQYLMIVHYQHYLKLKLQMKLFSLLKL